MAKYLKIILIIIIVITVIAAIAAMVLYRRDLTKEELADSYLSAQSKFITLPNGANMHYRDEGNINGEVIVLIHGGLGSLHNWEGWVKQLKSDYRLISMDILGHGLTGLYPTNDYMRYTQMETVHQLLQTLGIARYTVAGNSFGGGIALELVLKYPDEVERLILIDSEGIPNSDAGYDATMFSDQAVVTPQDASFYKVSWLENLASKYISRSIVKSVLSDMFYDKTLLTDDYVDRYYKIIRHTGNRSAQILLFRQGLYYISQMGPTDLKPRLADISCPTLVMHGAADRLVPLHVAETFHAEIRNSQLVIIAQAGHMPMIEQPQRSAAALRKFMTSY